MIWLVGYKGMLGTEVALALEAQSIPFIGTDKELDITHYQQLKDFSVSKGFAWIINCAAYTAVDKAEDDQDMAFSLNVEGPKNLARLATSLDIPLIHISTDYVFSGDGIKDSSGNLRPYKETDPMAPTGVYGLTKAQGEQAIWQQTSKAIILRTAWLYGTHGPNFVATMLRLMNERTELGVIHDQWGTPTWAYHLAQAIVAIITSPDLHVGTFHYSGAGKCSWYEFAQEIYRLGHIHGVLTTKCTINPLTTDQYPTKAKRPSWSVLDKSAFIQKYNLQPVPWNLALEEWFSLTYK